MKLIDGLKKYLLLMGLMAFLVMVTLLAQAQSLENYLVDSAEALRIMSEPRPTPPGKNAYFALYFLPYDIPPEDEITVWRKDMEALKSCAAFDNCGSFQPQAERNYPLLYHSGNDDAKWCSIRDQQSCLDKVAQD